MAMFLLDDATGIGSNDLDTLQAFIDLVIIADDDGVGMDDPVNGLQLVTYTQTVNGPPQDRLNALVNTAAGASWVSFHHGGGVGMGMSLHAGMVVVADGTPEAAARLERVLTTDPGMGVLRHADAGYERALEIADERGVRIPMRE